MTRDDDEDDFTSGGARKGITEVDYWIEYNREVGPTELKLGVVRWTYDQDNTGTLEPYATQGNFPGLRNGPDINSTESMGPARSPTSRSRPI
jgi:hypothetical protein